MNNSDNSLLFQQLSIKLKDIYWINMISYELLKINKLLEILKKIIKQDIYG